MSTNVQGNAVNKITDLYSFSVTPASGATAVVTLPKRCNWFSLLGIMSPNPELIWITYRFDANAHAVIAATPLQSQGAIIIGAQQVTVAGVYTIMAPQTRYVREGFQTLSFKNNSATNLAILIVECGMGAAPGA